MNVQSILEKAVKENVSDVFIVAGRSVSYRRNGIIFKENEEALNPDDTRLLVEQLYELAGQRDVKRLQDGDDDFSVSIPSLSRFRVSAFLQRSSLSAVIRVITHEIPRPEALNIPRHVIELTNSSKGMVLVTGPAGSGKTTTLACMIDHINHTQNKHIITLEDPVEFLHRHDRSIVSQREVNVDTTSYMAALRAALRQSPDVILLGEMRDYETMEVAMTAAETGHFLLSSLHTIGAASTIDRIIDVFPANQQKQIAIQLSMVISAVVSQQLVPTIDGHMIPAFEIMTATPAIRNMIRENKVHQIDGVIYSSGKNEMLSMDNSLLQLYDAGKITKETALTYSMNPDMLSRKI